MKIEKFNIEKAYFATLNSGYKRPWSSEKNKYIVLEYKYEFVKQYFENKSFDFKKTKYFQFLKKSKLNNFKQKYEGSINFAYSNPNVQCLRFIKLIKLFKVQRKFILLNINNVQKIAQMFLKNTYDINKKFPVETFDFRTEKKQISKESNRFLKLSILFNKLNLYKLIPFKFYYQYVFPSGKKFKKKFIILNGTHRLAIFFYFYSKKLFPKYFYYLKEEKF